MNENLKNKKENYEQLGKKLTNQYRENMKSIEKILRVIYKFGEIKENDNFETIVFKKYLELENVNRVAEYINSLGYRVKTQSYIGQRKYNGTDISELITSDINIEKDLKEVVQELQEKNYKSMEKMWL